MVDDEKVKLGTRLGYWIEHNKEHAQEFSEWAKKVETRGERETAEDMRAAAREMEGVNKCLSRALKRITEKEA
ncbi:hypothetical protein ACFLYF_02340 [Chloroflexota bacterium]